MYSQNTGDIFFLLAIRNVQVINVTAQPSWLVVPQSDVVILSWASLYGLRDPYFCKVIRQVACYKKKLFLHKTVGICAAVDLQTRWLKGTQKKKQRKNIHMILRFLFKRMLSVVITLTVIANTVSLLLFTGLSLLNGDGSTDHVHMFAEVAKNDTLDGGVGGGICHRMEFFTHSFLSRFSQLSETV